MVSHDRYFLDRLCTHLLIFHGDGRVEVFDGNFSQYASYKASLGNYISIVIFVIIIIVIFVIIIIIIVVVVGYLIF